MEYALEEIKEKEYGLEEIEVPEAPKYKLEPTKKERRLFTVTHPLVSKEKKKEFKEMWGFEPVPFPAKGPIKGPKQPTLTLKTLQTIPEISPGLQARTLLLHGSEIVHRGIQFGQKIVPHLVWPDYDPKEMSRRTGIPVQEWQRRQKKNTKTRGYFEDAYKIENQYFEGYLRKHPELQPPPGWERTMAEATKENPELLSNANYLAYIAIRNAPFTLAAIGTTIATTTLTGNPLAGLASAVGLCTAIEGYSAYEALTDEWKKQGKKITPEMEQRAAELGAVIGVFNGLIEVAGDLPILYAISKPIRQVVRRAIGRIAGKKLAATMIAKKGFANVMLRGTKRAIVIEIAENAEELIQNTTVDAMVDVVAKNKELFESISSGVQKAIINLPETAIAIAPFALLGFGGEVIQTKADIAERMGMPEELAAREADSKRKKIAEDVIQIKELKPLIPERAVTEVERIAEESRRRQREVMGLTTPEALTFPEEESPANIAAVVEEAFQETQQMPTKIVIDRESREAMAFMVNKVQDILPDNSNVNAIVEQIAGRLNIDLKEHVFEVEIINPELANEVFGPLGMAHILWQGQNYVKFKDNKYHHKIRIRDVTDTFMTEIANSERIVWEDVQKQGEKPYEVMGVEFPSVYTVHKDYNNSWEFSTPQDEFKRALAHEMQHSQDPMYLNKEPGTSWHHRKEFMEMARKGEENLYEAVKVPHRRGFVVKAIYPPKGTIGDKQTRLTDLANTIATAEKELRVLKDTARIRARKGVRKPEVEAAPIPKEVIQAVRVAKREIYKLKRRYKRMGEELRKNTPTTAQKVRYRKLIKQKGLRAQSNMTREEIESKIYEMSKAVSLTQEKLGKDIGLMGYIGAAWATVVKAGMLEFFRVGESARAVTHWSYEKSIKKYRQIVRGLSDKKKMVPTFGEKLSEKELVFLRLNGTLSDEDVATREAVDEDRLNIEMRELNFSPKMITAYENLKPILEGLWDELNAVYFNEEGKMLGKVKHYILHMLNPATLEMYKLGKFPIELVPIMKYLSPKVFAKTVKERQYRFAPSNMKELLDWYNTDLDKVMGAVFAIDYRYIHMTPAITRMKEYIKLAKDQERPNLANLMRSYINEGMLMRPIGFDYAMNESIKKFNKKIDRWTKGLATRILGEMPARKAISEVRFATYMFTLAFNLYLASRNLTQTLMMLSEIPPDYLGRGYEGIMEMVIGTEQGKQWRAYIDDPAVCTIMQGRMAVEALDLLRDYLNLRQYQKIGMFIYRMSDRIPVMAAWIGSYQYFKDVVKMNHEDAAFHANVNAYKAHYGYRREQLPAFMFRGGSMGALAGTLNTWWINYFTTFWSDSFKRMATGKDITGRKVTFYERIGPLVYMASTLGFLEMIRRYFGIDYEEILGLGVLPFFLATTTMYGLVNPIMQAAAGLMMVGAGLMTQGWKGYVMQLARGKEPYPLYGYKLRKKGLDILKRSPYQNPLFIRRVKEQIDLLRHGMMLRDYSKRAIRRITMKEWIRRWFFRTSEEVEERRSKAERSELLQYVRDMKQEYGKLCREEKYEQAMNLWIGVFDRYADRYWEETGQLLTVFPGMSWEIGKMYVPRKLQPFIRRVWPK